MKEIRCPFCGRENSRGKYCMFCGNPLAGSKAANRDSRTGNAGDKTGRNRDEMVRWDPETVYNQSRGRKIALLIAAALLAAIAAVVYITQVSAPADSQHPFAAPLGTPGATTLQQATSMLKKAGMKPVYDVYEIGKARYQRFDSFTILDEMSEYSIVKVLEGTGVHVNHVFREEKGYCTIDEPGPVFGRLLKKLTAEYGEPMIRKGGDYNNGIGKGSIFSLYDDHYYWIKDGDILALYYQYEYDIHLDFLEEFQGVSL